MNTSPVITPARKPSGYKNEWLTKLEITVTRKRKKNNFKIYPINYSIQTRLSMFAQNN